VVLPGDHSWGPLLPLPPISASVGHVPPLAIAPPAVKQYEASTTLDAALAELLLSTQGRHKGVAVSLEAIQVRSR